MRERVRRLNEEPVRADAGYVLYWMQMNRRVPMNHALAWAVHRADEFGLPLLVYEGLTCTYPYANDRIHTFMLEAVPGTAEAVENLGAGYCFYLRRKKSDPNDVLYRLAKDAAVVVTDDYPAFIAAQHNATVPNRIGVCYEVVDSSCIVPMQLLTRREYAAYTIRPRIHRLLPEYLKPLKMTPPRRRWNERLPGFHTPVAMDEIPALVASCEIDHSVPPSTAFRGGYGEARRRLLHFARHKLARYDESRNEPSAHGTSNLSPYIHFGQISTLEIALRAKEQAEKAKFDAGAFLEELIVRRELAFNFARFADTHSFDGLPEWARKTLREHDGDPRPVAVTPAMIANGETYDELWNATQKELLLRGKIHGYYRMYWGKKIIEWSKSHSHALQQMIELHDRHALDGRDPNTYTNILWCFGLHDRAWGERPIFGKVRYMSLEGLRRKTDTEAYMKEIRQLAATAREPGE